MKKSKIFFVAPAVYPFVKDGRGAEFAGSLPAYLQMLGHEVRVLMPKYSLINERKHIIRDIIRMKDIPVKLHNSDVMVSVKSGFIPESKTQIYFAEYEKFFKRSDLYRDKRTGEYFKDNDERFILMAKVAIETLKTLGWQPDIIHCCDWQSGILPAMIREEQKTGTFFKKTIVAFSIINAGEAGISDKSTFDKAYPNAKAIDKEKCFIKNKFSFLKAGIAHSDALTVPVTHPHLKSISKPSNDVEAAVAMAKNVIELDFGGDHNYWNPTNNNSLYKSYSVDKYERKQVNREGFLKDKRSGFVDEEPILGILAESMEEQGKAIAQFLKATKDLKLQIFILANDNVSAVPAVKSLLGKNPNHTIFTMTDPDDQFRHNFFAASDLLWIPPTDHFSEIFYLNGVHYGSVPLIRSGSLVADRFEGIREKSHSGNAFIFADEKEMLKEIDHFVSLFKDKHAWDTIVKKALKTDVSWAQQTAPVIKLYDKIFSKLK